MKHNPELSHLAHQEAEEAIRRMEEYQRAYQAELEELESEKALAKAKEDQHNAALQKAESEWMERLRKAETAKHQELHEAQQDIDDRTKQLQAEFARKESLLIEEHQADMKARIAQLQKTQTEQAASLYAENDDLKKQIEGLARVIEVKESLLNILSGKDATPPN